VAAAVAGSGVEEVAGSRWRSTRDGCKPQRARCRPGLPGTYYASRRPCCVTQRSAIQRPRPRCRRRLALICPNRAAGFAGRTAVEIQSGLLGCWSSAPLWNRHAGGKAGACRRSRDTEAAPAGQTNCRAPVAIGAISDIRLSLATHAVLAALANAVSRLSPLHRRRQTVVTATVRSKGSSRAGEG
jgi:hypothetical protein